MSSTESPQSPPTEEAQQQTKPTSESSPPPPPPPPYSSAVGTATTTSSATGTDGFWTRVLSYSNGCGGDEEPATSAGTAEARPVATEIPPDAVHAYEVDQDRCGGPYIQGHNYAPPPPPCPPHVANPEIGYPSAEGTCFISFECELNFRPIFAGPFMPYYSPLPPRSNSPYGGPHPHDPSAAAPVEHFSAHHPPPPPSSPQQYPLKLTRLPPPPPPPPEYPPSRHHRSIHLQGTDQTPGTKLCAPIVYLPPPPPTAIPPPPAPQAACEAPPEASASAGRLPPFVVVSDIGRGCSLTYRSLSRMQVKLVAIQESFAPSPRFSLRSIL